MRRTFTIAVFSATVLASASAVWALSGATHSVDQQKLQFSQSELTIKKGDSIEFTNSDRTAHNILIQSAGMFTDSGLQQPGQPTTVPFTKDGVFKVNCAIHPKMKMTVTVEK